MENFDQFTQKEKFPEDNDFYQYSLHKESEPENQLTMKEVFAKMKASPEEFSFISHYPALKILDGEKSAIQLFLKKGYVFSLDKNEEAYLEAKRDYASREHELEYEFLCFAKDSLGLSKLPNADKIAQYAWEECSKDGFEAVYEHMKVMSELFIPSQSHEPITPASIQSIINYIDEGEPDIKVVKAELGEIIERYNGTYDSTDK